MKITLSHETTRGILSRLRDANLEFAKRYPGESPRRQPVHTVYGGAHLFRADSARRFGEIAIKSLDQYAPDFITFARALQLPGVERLPTAREEEQALLKLAKEDVSALKKTSPMAYFALRVYSRVRAKLEVEPVEDFRIDFEDGYGYRSDEDEDGHAESAAVELAQAILEKTTPPYVGIRIKPFSEELRTRSIRTLDLFITALLEATDGGLPGRFVVTLPKVQIPEQVTALVEVLRLIEVRLGLPLKSIHIELMVEEPQALFDLGARPVLPLLIEAAKGRCLGVHFGTYDYTASLGVTAAHQTLHHPACLFAKEMIQVMLAKTGIWLSDGATTTLPLAIHKSDMVSPHQAAENRRSIHRAWQLHAKNVRESLVQGYYQGWDLHPAQLPARYGATFAFFHEALPSATERLKNFMSSLTQATSIGDVFDDAATGQGLLNFFLRALSCGAITEDEAEEAGLTIEEIRSKSFNDIMKKRREKRGLGKKPLGGIIVR